MLAYVVLDLVFGDKPRDWQGRTSPKWFILYRVGRKSLTQSINHGAWKAVTLFTESRCIAVTIAYWIQSVLQTWPLELKAMSVNNVSP